MEKSLNSRNKVNQLSMNMENLIEEYEEAHQLLNDQIEAVIYNDLTRLNKLIDKQLTKYEILEGLEIDFKNKIESIFEDFFPDDKTHTITQMLKKLDQPSDKLEIVRDRLHKEVLMTQKMRHQLMDLLEFAREHNKETLLSIYKLGQKDSERYNKKGKRKSAELTSVSINKKA